MHDFSEKEIANRALSLPELTRLRLASQLLYSVQSSALPSLFEDEAETLAINRAKDIDSGKAATLDFRSELKRIKSTLGS